MKKVLKYILVALVVIIFLGTFIFLFVNSKPKEVSYHELSADRNDIQRTAVVTGKIEPRNEVNIKPQINGIIAELYKEAGQHVERGEVIAKLTVIPDMNSLSSAQSRVRLAEINLKQAQINFEREQALYNQNLVSAEDYDKVQQQLNQAKEESAATQEALEVIRDGVSKSNAKSSSTLVRSTITGLILDIPVKVGNSVIQANTMNEGTTVATVANMNDLIFDGQIDETEVGALAEGMPVVITSVRCRTTRSTLRWSTSRRRRWRTTVPTSSRSRPPSRLTLRRRSARATAPTPRSCCSAWSRCSRFRKVPWNSKATRPSSM